MAQHQRKRQNQPAGSSNLRLFYWILGAVAVLGLGWVGITALQSSKAAQEPVTLSSEVLSSETELTRLARGVKVGPDNAPIRILVFSDYMCPACRQFATGVEPGMRNDFINAGKVQLVYYDFPLPGHRWSFVASRAARCAEDQGKFWEYHDVLFNKQQDWSYDSSAPLDKFKGYAAEVSLDRNVFDACLASDKHADLVSANKALGDRLGVRATPSLLMSPRGELLQEEWKDYGLMKQRLEKELATRTPAAPAAQ